MSVNRDAIIADNPLLSYCESHGWQLKRDGSANRYKCLCPLHEEKTPSFTVDAGKNLWKCFGCGKGGSVIDLHAQLGSMTIGEAMRDLSRLPASGDCSGYGGNGSSRQPQNRHGVDPLPSGGHPEGRSLKPEGPRKKASGGNSHREPALQETACYGYQDATGRVVYQVVRYEPKAFKQCQIMEGRRVWSMEGVERLPYRLPELLASPLSVWIVEGEKDVETLRAVQADGDVQSWRRGEVASGFLRVSTGSACLPRAGP